MARRLLGGRFVGREAELDRLQSLLDRASNGETCFALVSGSAGVGKSTLISEFVDRAETAVLAGSCLPLGEQGVPFAPISEMIRGLDNDPALREMVPFGLTRLSAVSPAETAEPTSRNQLFQAFLELVSRLAEAATTIMVIEDLHWADRSTRDLLSFLTPNLRSDRLLVVMSYRTDDVHRGHPLRPVLAELARNPVVDRVDLDPFPASLVAVQIEHLTGQPPSASTLVEVMKRTQGNPYFVDQLVAADGLGGRALPASLKELLLVRADVVTEATRRTLRIMSVAEADVDDESLALIAGTEIDDIRTHIREALDMRLLDATPNGTRFAHALLREALQEDLLSGERAEYHAAFAKFVASKLERGIGNPAGLLAQLAHHREAAGDFSEAFTAWSGAATAAEGIFAFAEADHHLSRIIANWDRVPSPAELVGTDYADLLGRAAENAFLGGDPHRASELAREAMSLVDATSRPLVAGLLHERLARYVRDTDEHDQALDLVQRALELVPENPPSSDRARVLAGVAGQLMTHGRYVEARSFATRAVDEARLTGSILAEADALNTLGVLATILDDVELGLALMRDGLKLAERCGDAHQQMRSYWNLTACLSDAGEWERALSAFHEATVQLPRLGQGHLLPELYANAVDILMRLGCWDEAQDTVDEASQRFPTSGDRAILIELVTERGQFGAARRLIESRAARNIFTDQEQQGWPLVHRATLETWEGHHEAARQAVDAALGMTAELDGPIATAYALTIGSRCEADAACDARRRGAADDVNFAVTRCGSFVGQIKDVMTRPGPASGWKREVGALMRQCEGELSRARDVSDPVAWATTTAAWDEMRMPYHAAYTRFRNAEASFHKTGGRDPAAVLLNEAHGVAASLGADPLCSLIETFSRRSRIDLGLSRIESNCHGLTAREREVLTTLTTGATNRQIASALFISEKTASVHVSNIMRKLAVSNRGEAAALAYREGMTC